MNQKQLFEVGSKLIGLYFFVGVLPNLLGILIEAFYSMAIVGEITARDQWLTAQYLLSYSLLVVLGLCLMRGSRFVGRIALQEDEDVATLEKEKFFTAGVKLFGVLLAFGTIPTFVRVLSRYVFVVTSESDASFIAAEMTGMLTDFVPSLAAILFGVLLFFRGELVGGYAFSLPQTPNGNVD